MIDDMESVTAKRMLTNETVSEGTAATGGLFTKGSQTRRSGSVVRTVEAEAAKRSASVMQIF